MEGIVAMHHWCLNYDKRICKEVAEVSFSIHYTNGQIIEAKITTDPSKYSYESIMEEISKLFKGKLKYYSL